MQKVKSVIFLNWAKNRKKSFLKFVVNTQKSVLAVCSSCYKYYNGAIKINSVQATDLDDFSNDTDIKCRITL